LVLLAGKFTKLTLKKTKKNQPSELAERETLAVKEIGGRHVGEKYHFWSNVGKKVSIVGKGPNQNQRAAKKGFRTSKTTGGSVEAQLSREKGLDKIEGEQQRDAVHNKQNGGAEIPERQNEGRHLDKP